MKLALFDFCETLVNYQTADVFVDYTLKKYNLGKIFQKILKIRTINKTLAKHWKIRKKIHLFLLRGLSEEQIQESAREYYLKYIKTNAFTYMIELIKEYQKRGYIIYIISGGYSVYIDLYVREYGLDGVIANEFKYKEKGGKKIFSGLIQRKDCMENEKINRLNEIFEKCKIDKSISYSDSLSDLPLLKWTNRGVLVSKYKERKSAKENGLEQIVLKNLEENTFLEFTGITDLKY